MGSLTDRLAVQGRIKPPPWLKNSIQYETIMGSRAYGCSDLDSSDTDIYGFCVPPKEMIFPHLAGEIVGFGKVRAPRFDQFLAYHVKTEHTEYDITIFSIVKYFQLCLENNPNMIDSLFTPRNCVCHSTMIGELVRENRRLFLHKGAWFKFKGYSYSQMHKLKTKNPEGKRVETIAKYGYDIKFAYHVVRLLNEVEQILTDGDIDLQRNREQLKAIRRGDWTEFQVEDYFNTKEKALEALYATSPLRHSPNEGALKQLLLNCLEQHYGSLDKCVTVTSEAYVKGALLEIQATIAEVLKKIP